MTNPVKGFEAKLPWGSVPMDDFEDKDNPHVNNQWYLLQQALFNRTGAGTGIWTLNPASIDDGGNTQADAVRCPANLNFVNSGGGGKGVSLPSCTPGNIIVVVNVSANNTNVYPSPDPPGDARINALAINGAFILAAGKTAIFVWETTTQLWTVAF